MFITLLKEIKVPALNTQAGSKFYRRSAAGKNDELNWLLLQRAITELIILEQLKLKY